MRTLIDKYSKLSAYFFVGHLLFIPIIQILGGVISLIDEDNWRIFSIFSIVFGISFFITGALGIFSFGSILSVRWKEKVQNNKVLRIFLGIISIFIIGISCAIFIYWNFVDLVKGRLNQELNCHSIDRWTRYGTHYVLSCSNDSVEFNISKDLYHDINPICEDGCLVRIDYLPGTHNVIGAETIEY